MTSGFAPSTYIFGTVMPVFKLHDMIDDLVHLWLLKTLGIEHFHLPVSVLGNDDGKLRRVSPCHVNSHASSYHHARGPVHHFLTLLLRTYCCFYIQAMKDIANLTQVFEIIFSFEGR